LKLSVERLPPDALLPSDFARAMIAGGSSLEGLCLPRSLKDLPLPDERFTPDERKVLAARLEERLTALAPPVAVLDSVRALATPGAFAVIAGQQPGLLSSPLLSFHKALHAIRLARALSQAWECPVVPIFWNHGDDHDIAEVHHTYLPNENLDLRKVRLAGLSSGRQPVSRLLLSEERNHLAALRSLLQQTLGNEPHAEQALELCMPVEGDSLVTAFTRSLTRILGPLGLVVLEPDWIRDDLSRALADVVSAGPAGPLEQGSADLRTAGLAPLIDPLDAALVYRVDAGGRHALRSGGDGFRYADEPGSRTSAELAAEIVGDLDSFSAGALLRPVVQDLCLPTAAYVGGWAELAYHAQLLPLRRAVGAPLTPVVPRMSCTLVEPDVARSLAKLEVSARDVIEGRGELELEQGAGDRPAVLDDLERVAEEAAASMLALKPGLTAIDRSLAQNVARVARQVRDQIGKLGAKAERVHANQSGKGERHLRRTRNALAPRGELQERVLGPLTLIARYGTSWVDALFEHLAPLEDGHLIATIQTDEAEGDS